MGQNQDAILEVSPESLIFDREIGRGEFGVVQHALMTSKVGGSETVFSVAVKILNSTSSQQDKDAFVREGLRLQDLHHENIVALVGTCLLQGPPMLILEYCPNGDLKRYLQYCMRTGSTLSLNHVLKLVLDVGRGFEYLQRVNFVHRDLAARNVLLDATFRAKIGDFGLLRVYIPGAH